MIIRHVAKQKFTKQIRLINNDFGISREKLKKKTKSLNYLTHLQNKDHVL